jgi:catechol 2,3-dioxygenase-like lactoylglutathione lyase family enzyme
MPFELDHIILNVNDRAESVAFFTAILGFTDEGVREPFALVRVSPSFTLQLAGWGTKGGEHLAFAMTKAEFDAIYARIKEKNVPYGDSYHAVGNNQGPGQELGSKGMGRTIYFFDPNKHLIEIRHYE